MASRGEITIDEIHAAFADDASRRDFPPILDVKQAATLLRVKPKTLYFWIVKGRLNGTFRKRGKRHLFWRDRLIHQIFNAPNWAGDTDGDAIE